MASFSALSAVDMAEGLTAGRWTSEALVSDCLSRIQSHNPRINAFCQVYEDAALEAARASDAARARGEGLPPLSGVPVAVKDLTDTAGLVTERGSRLFRGKVPTRDAPIVERLKASGAVIVGKTTTPELGWKGGSNSPLTGPTRNPWNPALTSGGSSSGSGAALAARLVPVALGSDGGGSVRIPASFCGVFALKGSLGRIPNAPASTTEALTCCGPMSVTVRDSALLFDLLKGPHPADHLSLPDEATSYLEVCARPPEGLRIAFAPSLFDRRVDAGVAAVVETAVARIAAGLPLDVEQPELALDDPFEAFETIWVAGRGLAYGHLTVGREAEVDPGFLKLVEASKRYRLEDWLAAMRQRAAFTASVERLFEDWDLLVCPTIPGPPFAAEDDLPPEQAERDSPVAWARWTPFTPPFNLSGHPAASVPVGFTPEGLPVGLQVVGPRFADARVLQFCAAVEALLPWRDRLPPFLEAA
jgi:aspartyl-tRNA(Asn)/glutamyl-tRNA(Gln) amidotransferase subunit A